MTLFHFYLLVVSFIGTSQFESVVAAPAASLAEWASIADNNVQSLGVIEGILKDAIFSSTYNVYTLRKVFQSQPGIHKICIPIAFNITFSMDQCTLYKSILWTKFDTADIAGKLLFYFASSGLSVFGFDWAGACDNPVNVYDGEPSDDYDSVSTIYLAIPANFSCNDTNIEADIHQSLLYLTTLVRKHTVQLKDFTGENFAQASSSCIA